MIIIFRIKGLCTIVTFKDPKLVLLIHIIIFWHAHTLYHDRTDEDIAMQVCEPYEINKVELREEDEAVYEFQASPDATGTDNEF